MIIAVTGANGSIGKELKPFLESLGHRLLKISSSTNTFSNNVFSYSDLVNQRIPFRVDLFIHLATINSNLKKNQIKDEVNITEKVVSSMPGLGCKHLIFFSSSKVYGDNSLDSNYFFETSHLNPVCHYGKAKKLCEELISYESLNNKFNSLILRMPPMLNASNSSNIGRLINFSKKGFPIPSIPQGDINKRSFVSFENIKIVLHSILENIEILVNNEIYNLSDDTPISLNDLLRASGNKRIYILPLSFGKIFLQLPILKNILIRLYGNLVLDNSKLKSDMGVKLNSTVQSLSAKNN